MMEEERCCECKGSRLNTRRKKKSGPFLLTLWRFQGLKMFKKTGWWMTVWKLIKKKKLELRQRCKSSTPPPRTRRCLTGQRHLSANWNKCKARNGEKCRNGSVTQWNQTAVSASFCRFESGLKPVEQFQERWSTAKEKTNKNPKHHGGVKMSLKRSQH